MAKFEETFCSQCGGSFGPGDSGYSHCQDHEKVECRARRDFVGITPQGKLIYVGIAKREDFDKIAMPTIDHGEGDRGGHVLSKTIEQNDVMVIFQHWLKEPRPLNERLTSALETK